MTVDRSMTCNKGMENVHGNSVLENANRECPNDNSDHFTSVQNATSKNISSVYVIPTNSPDPPDNKTTNGCIHQNVKDDVEKNSFSSRKNEKEKEACQNGIMNNVQNQHKVQLSERAFVDYDPHQHIPKKNPTTYWDTTFHLLKASLGTGILAMPNAFHNAGYAVGTIGTLIIGFMCTYNIHILVSSEYELCKRKKVPSMTYPETMQAAFEEGPSKLRWVAPYGRFVTNLFLLMYQIGTSSIYTVFIASNLKAVYETYYNTTIDVRIVTLYLLVPSILLGWVRNLKLLVPFSTIANAATILSFILIFRYVFDGIPSLADREPVGTMKDIPLFFGTVLFAMEAIGMVMPLKNQMKKPKKFGSLFGVLNASMLPISLLYTFIGFFGYLKYGSATEPSITLNLPQKELLAQAVKILYSASIFITYGLSNYIIFDIIWNNSIKEKVTTARTFWEFVCRTLIAVFNFFLAIAVPNLEVFISFVGAFCLSSIGIAFPAIIQILAFWNNHEDSFQFSMMVFKNFIIILIAILAFTIGVYSSVARFFEST